MTIQTKRCDPRNYKASKRSQTKYIVIHYTSNNGDTAKNNADFFARECTETSAHYFVDEHNIWGSVPEAEIAWHCGSKHGYKHPECRNSNSIGVEICMNDSKGRLRPNSIQNAVELVRNLMDKYSIPIKNVVRHYDVTGKYCPGPMVDSTELWNQFKRQLTQVTEEEPEMKHYHYINELPTWAQATFTRLMRAGIVARDEKGKIDVAESSIQPMVYMDRLFCGQLEKVPSVFRMISNNDDKEIVSRMMPEERSNID